MRQSRPACHVEEQPDPLVEQAQQRKECRIPATRDREWEVTANLRDRIKGLRQKLVGKS